jgi:predicted NBD/HSP70 family sugar kinase
MIMNGQLIRGPSGMAGEFGHVALNETGPRCGCGNQGCWEAYASNTAALRYYAEALGQSGKGPVRDGSNLTFDDLLLAVEHDDPAALKALGQMAHYLGTGIAMLVTGLAPDVIVVVGEVTRVWDKVGPVVIDAVKGRSFTHAASRIIATGPPSQPRLRGIVALVVQNVLQRRPLQEHRTHATVV